MYPKLGTIPTISRCNKDVLTVRFKVSVTRAFGMSVTRRRLGQTENVSPSMKKGQAWITNLILQVSNLHNFQIFVNFLVITGEKSA